jgi:hypothetical protein
MVSNRKQRPVLSEKHFLYKGVPDFENAENVLTLILLDVLMDSAYSTKVSELFTSQGLIIVTSI